MTLSEVQIFRPSRGNQIFQKLPGHVLILFSQINLCLFWKHFSIADCVLKDRFTALSVTSTDFQKKLQKM